MGARLSGTRNTRSTVGVVSGFILIQRVWDPSVGNKEAAGWNRKTKTYSLSKLPKPIQTRAKKFATSEGHSGQPPATDLGVRPAGSRLHSAYMLPARPSRARRESAVKNKVQALLLTCLKVGLLTTLATIAQGLLWPWLRNSGSSCSTTACACALPSDQSA